MQIQLSELLSHVGKVITVEAFYEADWFQCRMGHYKVKHKEPFVIRIENLGNQRIAIQTQIKVTLKMRCDRCLKPVEQTICSDILRTISMCDTDAKEIETLDEAEYLTEHVLDTEALVNSEIHMNLPMKTLCRKDCKGICRKCGTDLNLKTCNCDFTEVDPRMEKLRSVFQGSKQ